MEAQENQIFINRELSWLDFNRRVLALSKDKTVPLAEQMKFAAIYGSNLDEFFMVRVGSLYDRTLLKNEITENKTNMTAAQQLAAIMPKTAELQEQCDKNVFRLRERLAEVGYRRIDFEKLDREDEKFWKKYFQNELYPVLSPQIIDHRHPFPFLRNQEIYLCATLKAKGDEEVSFGLIPIGSQFERLLYLKKEETVEYGLAEELIFHFAQLVFPKGMLQKKCLFRVTRNADIDVKEGMFDQDIDYRQVMSELLKKRRKLAAVRLQFWNQPPQEIEKYLCDKLVLPQKQCFAQAAPLDLSCFFKLAARLQADGRSELFYPPAKPLQAPAGYRLGREVETHDMLLAYPYQSMRPFIKMLMAAAFDPEVISIKMTLYRMAHDSQIVQALVAAAENGKEVVTVVELRARFDEQNNIDWSKQLEEAGCTVIYGLDEYKVHSKLTLITRKRAGKYHYTTQVGTGNYNEKTSEQYTDLAFVTTSQEIGEEAAAVFNNLAVERLTDDTQYLLVAPLCFKSVLLAEIDREIGQARMGLPARITLKNNSISDKNVIEKLEEASCAGVATDMIVRGICCVRAGVPGHTENLRVRSIVGRYLEHSRIYAFGEGENLRIYIASGDFLTRNTERRVEVGIRIEDRSLKEKLWGLLQLQLADNVNAREMKPDGSYSKVKPGPGERCIDSQMELYEYFSAGFGATVPEKEPRRNKKAGLWKRLDALLHRGK
ncbi:polyphosphate kinase [Oscillospiraceae bacterium]|uniref:polyphosphate kinase 1 n=1 Tax=Allofournierella sp. TaxID=1940256 RepID=UPI00208D8E94|nr:polyphosphate kinase [Oscillospiraceae bacterium]